jgi:hypothetical protein
MDEYYGHCLDNLCYEIIMYLPQETSNLEAKE